MNPVFELTRARVREFLREPEVLFWVFAFPVLMALALGLAFRSRGHEPVYAGVEESTGAGALVDALERAGGIHTRLLSREASAKALRNGDVHVVIVPGEPPVYRFDPTRTESRLARLAVNDALQRAAGRSDRWPPREDAVIAPGSRYIDWLVPGLLGMNIMSTGLWSIGFSVAYARTKKLLKRLVATPMRRSDYLLSHMLGRLVFLGLEVTMLLGVTRMAFGIPIRGSLAALAAIVLLGAVSFAGIAVLAASRVRTVEAVSGILNVIMLPMWIMSGVFFSSANFPDAMQPVIRVLPLTALNEALRAIMIEGAPAASLGPQIAILTLWGGASFAIALKIFRWR